VRALVEREIDLARVAAHRLQKQIGASHYLQDELHALAREGLLEAARTYSGEHGVPFKSWAYLKMRGAIFDGLRRQGGVPRAIYARLRALEAANQVREGSIEGESAAGAETAESADQRIASATSSMAMAMAAGFLAVKYGVSEEIPDPNVATPEVLAGEKELIDHVKSAIDARPDKERKLLTRIYFGGATLEEAGKELGLSKSWCSRMHARALEAVAEEVRRRTGPRDEE
ncbi:MAG: sigma-70 family RNA polymerase sigma factor, partial [Polyangiaceae bacterium]